MPSNAELKTLIDVTITPRYSRVDKQANRTRIVDSFAYTALNRTLAHGNGRNRANQIFYTTSRLVNSTEYWNLDDGSLVDVFGNALNFDAVKALVIHNLEDDEADRFLEVHFKNERYYIGPGGYRLIVEPFSPGIEAIVSSGSTEEGQLSVSSNAAVNYDLIIIGSSVESSESSI